MYNKKFFLPLAIVILFFTNLSFSQQTDTSKIFRLSEIVVTATKTNLPEIEAASSISVIDSLEIADKPDETVFDLLKSQYGLSFSQQGAPGSLSYVYLRGSGPGDTQILIDGVPVNMPNDPSNTFDFAELPSDNIQRIEILRGPQSTLYGSNALAGVINIITKQGYGSPKFFISGEGGSYNTYKGLAGLNGSINDFNYSITASKFRSDGFSSASQIYNNTEKDGTTNYNISSRLGYNFSDNFGLNFYYRFAKANTGLDQNGGPYGDDPSYIYNLEESSYKVKGKLSLLGGRWDQIYGISYFRNVREYKYDSTSIYNPTSSSSIYDGNRVMLEWQNNLALIENNLITFGVDAEKENASSDYFSNTYGFEYDSRFPLSQSSTTGAYIQDQINIKNYFFASLGLRYDNHDRFGSIVTYRFAPAFLIQETGTKIKATIGTAFKSPSLFDLYDPQTGNLNLKPEKSIGWDAGIEQYFFRQNLTAGLNYFSTNYNDLFGSDSSFKEININKAVSNGVEFYLSLKKINGISISVNYTLTKTKDKSAGSPDYNLPLLRRPENKFSVNLNYDATEKINFGTEILYVGKRDDKYFANFFPYTSYRITLGGYTLVNLSASYKFSNLIEIYGRVNNLFNKYYEEIFGYGTPGLSGYAGFRLNFD